MSETFDPYHHWLGIPPHERPINHYRLLGIPKFESDREVISAASDRLMSFVRTFRTGRRMNEAEKILGEIAAAKVCLLNPTAKTLYDASLQDLWSPAPARQGGQVTVVEPPIYSPPVAPPPPPLRQAPAAPAIAVIPVERGESAFDGEEGDEPAPSGIAWGMAVAGGGIIGVLLVTMLVIVLGRPAKQETAKSKPKPATPIDVEAAPPPLRIVIHQEGDGSLNFTAPTAEIISNGAKMETLETVDVIRELKSINDLIRWEFQLTKPGPFRVELTYAANAGSDGGECVLSSGQQETKPLKIHDTGGDTSFRTEEVGFLWLKKSGKYEMQLKPVTLMGDNPLCVFKSVRLVPTGN